MISKVFRRLGLNKTKRFSDYGEQWTLTRQQTGEMFHWTCQECGYKPPPKFRWRLHRHHKHKRAKGGSDRIHNLTLLCEQCHAKHHPHMKKKLQDPWRL